MKVVINDCYGGFSLSREALIELIKKDSDAVTKKSIEEYTGGRLKTMKELMEEDRWLKYHEYRDGFYTDDFTSTLFKDDFVYFIEDSNEIRTHPDIIEIVEKLGDRANGRFAKLKIVEIPDDVEWEIEEYDGREWVSEKHRWWS